VCGSLNKRSGSGGSSGNTVCSTAYVRNIIRTFYFRTYFRACVSGYGMRPPHWLRRFCKDRFGINWQKNDKFLAWKII
jgi:hypothetical protein